MNNPYRRLMKIVNDENIDSEELLRGLLASVFSESCECCNQKFHSEQFAEGFRHLVREMRFCHSLSEGPVPMPWKPIGFLDALNLFLRRALSHPPGPKAEVKVEPS
jgi:hypothetical protein